MDLQLLNTALPFAFARKRKKWVLLLAALGFTGYSVHRVYQLPSIAHKRKRISKLLAAFLSVAEAVSDSADSIGIVSKDLKEFLQSNSDQIPNSFKQISKITGSDEFSESLARATQAVTLGVLQGSRSESCGGTGGESSFTDRVMDKLFSTAGSGFASVVVGSFARNLVMGVFSDGQASTGGSMDHVPHWVNVVCGDKCKELIGDCIQMFVSTAVAVYLDKTMDINFCEEMLSSLTHPKHEAKMKDMVVSVCNGAVETLVVTSHQVLTNPNSLTRNEDLWQQELLKRRNSFDQKNYSGNWVSKVSSSLAVPSNKRFVLDVTGRITFETVRSFLECLLEKLYEGVKRCLNVVHEGGLEVVRYAAAKSSVVATICLSLCMHILDGAWILVPA